MQSLSGYYDILAQDGLIYRTRARGNFRAKKQAPLVGDWVDFKADNQKEGYILKIYPRKNSLVRPPVANIDVALVMTACVEPDFSSNLLDRQLIMLAFNNIKPLLCFSKADLLMQDDLIQMQKIIAYYQEYFECCLLNQENLDDLKVLLAKHKQKVLVVMGQTGAGKSTLLNRLKPTLQLPTGAISKALSRGKHTTRKVTLLEIAQNLIADTPGFSSFDLLEITKEQLPLYYPDFVKYQTGCKFRGCLHINEPKCGVKEAVLAKKIMPSRYDNYLQFHTLLANKKPSYK